MLLAVKLRWWVKGLRGKSLLRFTSTTVYIYRDLSLFSRSEHDLRNFKYNSSLPTRKFSISQTNLPNHGLKQLECKIRCAFLNKHDKLNVAKPVHSDRMHCILNTLPLNESMRQLYSRMYRKSSNLVTWQSSFQYNSARGIHYESFKPHAGLNCIMPGI